MERRHPIHVERYGREIARLAGKERDDLVDRTLDIGRQWRFASVRKPLEHTGASVVLTALRELHTDHATLAPRDAASPNRRIEQRKEA